MLLEVIGPELQSIYDDRQIEVLMDLDTNGESALRLLSCRLNLLICTLEQDPDICTQPSILTLMCSMII